MPDPQTTQVPPALSRVFRDRAIRDSAASLVTCLWELADKHAFTPEEAQVVLAEAHSTVSKSLLKDALDQEIPQA